MYIPRIVLLVITVLCVTLSIVFSSSADIASVKIKEKINQIHQLETALGDMGDLSKMLNAASNREIGVPDINSNYYAERIGRENPELALLEMTKRTFGLKLAHALDKLAGELVGEVAVEDRVAQADLLLDLADWLKSEKSYGNYLLTARCENLAIVPMAYLGADLDFSMERVEVMKKRLMSHAEAREFRKAVLNSEAPEPFIGNLSGSESEQDRQLQYYWAQGWNRMLTWQKAHGLHALDADRSKLPEPLAYFVEERLKEPFTTVNNWEVNRHSSALVNGARDMNLRNLESFLKFRKHVDAFPTKPPSWWEPNGRYSAIEAAFKDAWEPFRMTHGVPYQTAAQVYSQVMSGEYMDWESYQIRDAK